LVFVTGAWRSIEGTRRETNHSMLDQTPSRVAWDVGY
jgi:hypothetical protein